MRFKGGAHYLYDHAATGADLVRRMKELAAAGRGLNGYINKTVRKKFARKW